MWSLDGRRENGVSVTKVNTEDCGFRGQTACSVFSEVRVFRYFVPTFVAWFLSQSGVRFEMDVMKLCKPTTVDEERDILQGEDDVETGISGCTFVNGLFVSRRLVKFSCLLVKCTV